MGDYDEVSAGDTEKEGRLWTAQSRTWAEDWSPSSTTGLDCSSTRHSTMSTTLWL